MSDYEAIVVGGGHNGLVTGAYLARAGLRTLILERREVAGGQVATDELVPGVHVPTLAHTVGRLRPGMVADLKLAEHGLSLVQSEARAFLPHPDGRSLTLWGDLARSVAEIERLSAHDAAAWPGFDGRLRALSGYLGRLAAATPPDVAAPSAAAALTGLRLGLDYRGLTREDARALLRWLPMAVADLVREWFEEPMLQALLAWRGVALTGMGPLAAGTGGVLLSETAGTAAGAAGHAVVVRGGPGALAGALVAAARAFGAEVRTGAEVVAIGHRDDAVGGVVLAGGEEIGAPIVASGLDPRRTLLDLLDPAVLGPTLRWRAGNIRQTGRTAKVNLVLDGLPRFPGSDPEAAPEADRRLRGRIVVAASIEAMERASDAAKYGQMPERPVLEVTIPTLLDPSLAPSGTHVLSAIVQGVPGSPADGRWDADARDRLGDLTLSSLEEVAPGLTARVSARQVIAPPDLEADYGLSGGHPLHAEVGLDQWFAWRPMLGMARYRLPLRGLYLCSSGAHPGGGVTGAPGANAAREILADQGRGSRRAA
jgi:phytoene dehydrogenase-like protein